MTGTVRRAAPCPAFQPSGTPTHGVDRLGARMSTDVPMARVARQRAGHRLRRDGRRAAAGAPPRRELVGREDFAARLPLLRRRSLPPARRPGPATTRWDAADGFRYDWLVDDLEAFADAMGLTTFHLLGFSMGGATALGSRRVSPSGSGRSSSSGSRPSANRGRPSRGG